MQNRYAGDIGDYIKLALLRHISVGKKLGVAWYLYPDESHNFDGKHTHYLSEPGKWRHLDPVLFDALGKIITKERSIAALQGSDALNAIFASDPLTTADLPANERSNNRSLWFENTQRQLSACDLVFADPDNGIVDNTEKRRRQKVFGKQMPLSEVTALARDRTAVIYHHNTRFKGGHDAEVGHWLSQLGPNAIAVRANAYSCRTFFIVNPDPVLVNRAASFCDRWADHNVRLHLSQ